MTTPETTAVSMGYVKTVIDLEKEIEALRAQVEQYREGHDRYQELLFAVGKKYPDETRHQTALRYIRHAEFVNSAAIDKARKA